MGIAIRIDWQEEYNKNPEKWDNHGRRLIEEACTHKTQDKSEEPDTNMRYSGSCDECGFCEDSAQPMMNFLYPLETEPHDEDIVEVVKETNCTVMENTETGEQFIVLCGGGMDLSQDIALAYVSLEKLIPYELATSVSMQEGLSQSGANWKRLKRAVIESLELYCETAGERLKLWRGLT